MEPNEQPTNTVENTEGQQAQTVETPQTETPPIDNNQKPNQQKNTTMAIIAYIIFFVPLLTESKDDPFVKYHVKQGLILFLVACAGQIASFFPLLGAMLSYAMYLFVVILLVLGIINAANGDMKELPVVGQYAKKLNF